MYVQPQGIFTRILRTLINNCSRQNTLNFIKNTISETYEIIKKYTKSEDETKQHILINIIQDLELSKKGIVNLKNTYLDDLKIGCDLDTILQEIEAFLYKYNNSNSDSKFIYYDDL